MTLRPGSGQAGTRIVIFAKAPVPGKVKTRLIPALGAEGAARLATQMLERTLEEATAVDVGAVELCSDPAPDDVVWDRYRDKADLVADQGPGDLGERLACAARRVIDEGDRILLIGTDSPDLDRVHLRNAANSLDEFDAVIHPSLDGGYALLGFSRFEPSLFEGIAWSTDQVAAQTIARIEALGWSLHIGETLRDIDVPADLP